MTAAPTLVLNKPTTRAIAQAWVARAPLGTRVRFEPPRRTLPQNSRLHAMITDVARQVEWDGRKHTVESWKDIFTAALRTAKHQLETVPGINGGFVMLGMHTSGMSKEEVGVLMDLIEAFGAEHGVTFSDVTPAQLQEA